MISGNGCSDDDGGGGGSGGGGESDGGEIRFNAPCFLAKWVLRKYLLQNERSQRLQ